MQSAKVVTTLKVRWKKSVIIAITLDSEDAESGQVVEGNTGHNYIKVEMPFNSFITELFESSYTDELIQRLFAHIKTQVQNPRKLEFSLTLNQIMRLHINFHKLALTRSRSYIDQPEWIANKKAVINPKSNDKKCFKWAAPH